VVKDSTFRIIHNITIYNTIWLAELVRFIAPYLLTQNLVYGLEFVFVRIPFLAEGLGLSV
jgi:hypothetical protein